MILHREILVKNWGKNMSFFTEKKRIISALQQLEIQKNVPVEELVKQLYVEGVDENNSKLLQAINAIMAQYQQRILQEANNVKLINDAVSSGMWNMYIDKNENVEKVFWSDEFRKMIQILVPFLAVQVQVLSSAV